MWGWGGGVSTASQSPCRFGRATPGTKCETLVNGKVTEGIYGFRDKTAHVDVGLCCSLGKIEVVAEKRALTQNGKENNSENAYAHAQGVESSGDGGDSKFRAIERTDRFKNDRPVER